MQKPAVFLAYALLLSACAAAPTPLPTASPTVGPTAVPTLAPTATAAPTPKPTRGPAPAPVDAFEHLKQLGRGVNFGNALEAPNEGEWGMTLEERFFDLVKEGGFNTIRLPTRWSSHALTDAPYTIDEAFFERVDWAVDNATQRGLNIVVNMHHYEELMTAPDGNRERFVAIWRQIAQRYADRPASVLFELCNEPNAMSTGAWTKLFTEALAAVRESNPTRTVVIGGVDWNSIKGLEELKLPENDRHLIATFHYYAPFQFTHQGAEWVKDSGPWLGTEWKGNGSDRAYVDFDLAKAQQWSRANERPVWMGEFGAYSKADMPSRGRWTAYVAREAERRGFAWSYWEFGAGFGVYDRAVAQWVAPIKEALIP
jgi:endoglucanase